MSATNNPGCLGWLLGLLGGGAAAQTEPAGDATTEPVRYVLIEFLSPAERSFYGVLTSVVGARAVVCPKVRIGDLVRVPGTGSEPTSARNRINQKHADFVLCAPDTLKPLLVLELDDASHARPDRQTRDDFVDNVFQAAGLPLLRVPNNRNGYAPAQLSALLAPYMPSSTSSVSAAVASPPTLDAAENASDTPPICPQCGVPMVVRTAARGGRAGQSFFGCPHYPRCRETRPLSTNSQEQPSA